MVKRIDQKIRVAGVIAVLMFLAGCGGGVRGTYTAGGRGFFERLTFRSGGKVDIVFMSMTKEATYEVDGKKVKVTSGGDTQVFTIDDKGCLDGGQLLGRYCRSGGESEQALSGVYKAGQEGDGIALNFLDEQRVRVQVSERGRVGDTAVGTYKLDGKKVIVKVQGGTPLVLSRDGDALEGSMEGAHLRFVRE